jgi:hypothetical protein
MSMMEPKFKPGDMVRIADEPWSQHAGDIAIVTKATVVTLDGKEFISYDLTIPKQRLCAAEKFIGEFITHFDSWKMITGDE